MRPFVVRLIVEDGERVKAECVCFARSRDHAVGQVVRMYQRFKEQFHGGGEVRYNVLDVVVVKAQTFGDVQILFQERV